MRVPHGKCHSDFREDYGCVPLSLCHTSESVPDCFPEFGRVEPLGKAGGASRAPRLGLLETKRVFPWLSHMREPPVWLPGKCM